MRHLNKFVVLLIYTLKFYSVLSNATCQSQSVTVTVTAPSHPSTARTLVMCLLPLEYRCRYIHNYCVLFSTVYLRKCYSLILGPKGYSSSPKTESDVNY